MFNFISRLFKRSSSNTTFDAKTGQSEAPSAIPGYSPIIDSINFYAINSKMVVDDIFEIRSIVYATDRKIFFYEVFSQKYNTIFWIQKEFFGLLTLQIPTKAIL